MLEGSTTKLNHSFKHTLIVMKTKITKESRNLLIALLLGDGTISNNFVFKLAHCIEQKDYLEWKIKQLNNAGIRNN